MTVIDATNGVCRFNLQGPREPHQITIERVARRQAAYLSRGVFTQGVQSA
jgi:hypothetical protein